MSIHAPLRQNTGVRLRHLLLAAGLVLLGSCTKSRGPSPEHAQAMSRYQAVMSETLDPSYADPAFDEVEALLRAVPEAAKERAAALALAEEIAAGRARQRKLMAELIAFQEARAADDDAPRAAPEATAPEAAGAGEPLAEAPEAAEAAAEAVPAAEAAPTAAAPARRRPSSPVIIYTTSWCGVCVRAKSYMDSVKVAYVEKDVEKDERAGKEYNKTRKDNGLRPGVPLIDVNGQYMVGFGAQNLERLLKKQGYL